MAALTVAIGQIDTLNSRIDQLEKNRVGQPVFGHTPEKLRLTKSVDDILARATQPDKLIGESSVLDPLMEYGMGHKYFDDQVVRVVDEEVIEAYRRGGEIGPVEELVGLVRHYMHRNRRTNEPKYRLVFRSGVAKNNFHESQLEPFYA